MALNLEVNILGEFRNLTKATKGATRQLKAFENGSKRISRGINAAFAAIGVGISFNALKSGIKSVVDEASNLEQAYGAAAAVFKSSSDVIIDSSKAAATAYGLSANQYLQSANLIGAQLSNLGFTQAEYTKQTQELVELGADLAATFGGTAYDAVQALSAVFRGEYNQVERYGVSIRKSDINARLAARGQDKLTGEMLKQAEALAALEILYGQTEAAQGQFSRESSTLAGATQILQASFTNAKIEIGEGFYPVVAAVTTFLNDNIDVFTNLADAVGNKVKAAFEGSGDSAENFGTKIITALTELTDFLNGDAGPGNAFYQISEQGKPFFELLGAIGELGKGLIKVLDGLFDGLFGWITLFVPGTDALGGFAGVIQFVAGILNKFGEAIGYIISFFIPFTTGFKLAGKLIGAVSGAFSKAGTAIRATFNNILKVFDNMIGGVVRGIAQYWTPTVGKAKTVVEEFGRFIGGLLNNGPFAGIVRFFATTLPGAIRSFADNPVIKYAAGVLDFLGGAIRSAFGLSSYNSGKGNNGTGSDRRFENLRPTTATTGNPYAVPDYLRVIEEQTQAYKDSLDTGLTIPEIVLPELTTPEAESEFVKGMKRMAAVLEDTIDDARNRITNGIENFRDAVSLSFGVITNGAFATFDVNRVIRQMQRIRDAAATFADDIRKLQEQGADQALIDELLGMDPISGATAASGLLSSGRLQEFLDLRNQLAGIGGAAAEAANVGIYGSSTDDLVSTLDRLNRLIENGVENVYNITVNNANNMTAKQIIDAVKSYEKTQGKKVFTN